VPGVITELLEGSGLSTYRSITVVYNATPVTQTQTLSGLARTSQRLHPVQQDGADPIVRQAGFSSATGTFTVPADTVAVFVQR